MEDQLLEKILATVSEIRDGVREMRTQLFGAAEKETEHGRLPKLERLVDEHATRLDELENEDNQRKGYRRGAAAVGAAVGGVVGALIAWVMHALELVKRN